MKRLRESWERAKAVGKSDKGDAHSYLEIYDLLFARFEKVKLLEIGVKNGGSMAMFKDYFQQGSIIHGIESNAVSAKLSGVAVFFGNAYTDEMVSSVGNYDVIIDDGSHKIQDVKFFIKKYLEKVNPGGLLIVEDIQPDFNIKELFTLIPEAYRPCSYVIDCKNAKGRTDDVLLVVHRGAK